MQREILFKAKRKDNNEWAYGNYVYEEYSKRHYITNQLENSHQLIEVMPETIFQYTGLKDKNGVKIFENDLLKPPLFLDNEQRTCLCIYNQENNVNEIIGFGLYWKDSYFGRYQDLVCSDEWDEFEVIGNIFDEKVPKKIKFKGYYYEFDDNKYINKTTGTILGHDFSLDLCLNEKIEIIEDKPKMIEKIIVENNIIAFDDKNQDKYFDNNDEFSKAICIKLNELIEQVNYLLEKSDKE